MQTSITSFFKIQPPKETTEAVEPEEGHSSPEDGDKGSRSGSGEGRATPKLKRPLDSDEEDEDNVKMVRNKKRATLSSAETTPVKGDAKPTTSSSENEPVKRNEQEAVKSPVAAPKQLFAQSPLLNVQSLIRAKISSGSTALHENIGVTWFKALQPEFDKPYFKTLSKFVSDQRANKTVYPPADKVFTWTHHHTIRDTRVVVIGQDPYHGPNQAHGLSFSVQRGVAIPKSLQNIYAELSSDIPGFKSPGHGELVGWSKQGVLMLNSCLTVNAGAPNSHQGKGWEKLTDAVISWISKNVNHKVVFLLWGRFAQNKSSLIDKRHKILTAAHPSPLSAHNGFMGCKHFSQTNAFLKSQKLPEIDWCSL